MSCDVGIDTFSGAEFGRIMFPTVGVGRWCPRFCKGARWPKEAPSLHDVLGTHLECTLTVFSIATDAIDQLCRGYAFRAAGPPCTEGISLWIAASTSGVKLPGVLELEIGSWFWVDLVVFFSSAI